MFIITAKLPRRRVVTGVTTLALCCCCAVGLLLQPRAVQVAASTTPDPNGVNTAEERIDYLSDWGWTVEETPISIEELLIPETLDDSYTDYIALQSELGFDLEALTGKRVKRYSYTVTNHPSDEENVQVNLLIYRNDVVGGEVLSPTVDGFLHSLAMP